MVESDSWDAIELLDWDCEGGDAAERAFGRVRSRLRPPTCRIAGGSRFAAKAAGREGA